MKVFMISKACYLAAYRRKLEEMAALGDIELTLLAPPYSRFGLKKPARLEPGNDRGYEMIIQNPFRNGSHHLHFYTGLHRHLRRIRPDILHIDEEPYDLVTVHALSLARRLGIKCLFFTWQNLYRRFPPPFSLFESYTLSRSQAGIAGNPTAADILRRKGFRAPVYVIPQFGVDVEAHEAAMLEARRERGGSERPMRIGYAGRLVEQKGLLVLLEALGGLDGDWDLAVYGAGPLEQRLTERARDLGIDRRIHLHGSVPSTALAQHLARLDALVLPSLSRSNWVEQFGRVLVEAMAAGVAVLGSDSGEIPWVIGEAGLIAPEGDQLALRAQLQRLLKEPGLRQELAERGLTRARTHFSHQTIASQTQQAYRRMMGEPTE